MNEGHRKCADKKKNCGEGGFVDSNCRLRCWDGWDGRNYDPSLDPTLNKTSGGKYCIWLGATGVIVCVLGGRGGALYMTMQEEVVQEVV
jgi:hypothetical protein